MKSTFEMGKEHHLQQSICRYSYSLWVDLIFFFVDLTLDRELIGK